jgi:hypothetical protein
MSKRCLFLFGSLALLALPCAASTNIFVVANTLAFGVGSLSNAISQANNASASSTNFIQFNIPPFDATVKTIAPATPLPAIASTVIIDGYSQPGASSNTLANGDNARLLIELNGAATSGNGLFLTRFCSGSAIRGLIINGFSDGISLSGATNCVIEGNFIGTDPTGMLSRTNFNHGIELSEAVITRIGGTNSAARNLLSGNSLMGLFIGGGSISNLVQGNFIGVDATGTNGLGNRSQGITIVGGGGATANVIGGPDASARNIISANGADGIDITFGPFGNLVQGNYVGTDVTGTRPLGNNDGVQLSAQGSNSVIGNVICANRQHGVVVEASEINSVVQGNLIGVDATGTNALGNALDGVVVTDGIGTSIGGTNAGAGNLIAHNGAVGVSVYYADAVNNSILGNSIFDNGKLGIDFNVEDGVSPNDAGDSDGGPNHLQNFPIITSVALAGGSVTLGGTLNSSPNAPYRLEFFSNPSCDPSGHGEGKTFLGFTTVVTDGGGNASFNVTLPNGTDTTFTATATDANGNTSEFSLCAEALLSIRNFGGQVRVFWANTLTNFDLQTNHSVTNPNGWGTVPGAAANDGQNLFRDFPPTNSPLFFRLRSQ